MAELCDPDSVPRRSGDLACVRSRRWTDIGIWDARYNEDTMNFARVRMLVPGFAETYPPRLVPYVHWWIRRRRSGPAVFLPEYRRAHVVSDEESEISLARTDRSSLRLDHEVEPNGQDLGRYADCISADPEVAHVSFEYLYPRVTASTRLLPSAFIETSIPQGGVTATFAELQSLMEEANYDALYQVSMENVANWIRSFPRRRG